jgi:hypothetical protein
MLKLVNESFRLPFLLPAPLPFRRSVREHGPHLQQILCHLDAGRGPLGHGDQTVRQPGEHRLQRFEPVMTAEPVNHRLHDSGDLGGIRRAFKPEEQRR